MTSVARNVRCVRKTFDSLDPSLVACHLYVYTLGIHSSNKVRETLEKTIKEEFGHYSYSICRVLMLLQIVVDLDRVVVSSTIVWLCYWNLVPLTTRNNILATSSTFYIGEKELFGAIASENWNHKWKIIDCLRCRCGILRATKVEPWNVNT